MMTRDVLILILAVAGLGTVMLAYTRPTYALLLYAFTIPMEDSLVIGSLGTVPRLLAVVFAVSYLWRIRFRLRAGVMGGLGWAWLLLACASWYWAVTPTAAMSAIFTLLQLFVVALLIADVFARDPEQVTGVLWAFTLGASITALLGVFHYIGGQSVAGTARVSAFSEQSVAHFASALMPAFLFLWQRAATPEGARLFRWAAIALCPILLAGVLLSGTRSAWLGLLVALGFVYLPRLPRRALVAVVVSACVLLVGLSRIPQVGEYLAARVNSAVSSGGEGRTDIWKVGVTIALRHPLVGVGYGNFGEAFDYQAMLDTRLAVERWGEIFIGRAPHNIYLSTATELGIPGLLLLLGWLLPLLWRPLHDPRMFHLQGILLAFLVQGAFLDILNRKYFWLAVALVEGVACARGAWTHAQRGHAPGVPVK